MNRDATIIGVALLVWVGFLVFWLANLVQITSVAVITGLVMTVIVALAHYAEGPGWEPTEDISQQVLERRAESVPETGLPEPMNRSIGAGGGAGAITAGEAEGELEEGQEEAEEGFDPAAVPDDEIEVYDIEFTKEGETIEVANNETILDAGEEHGWDLPYACREGQCLSCAGRAVDGPAQDYIRHSNNEMLNEEEMNDGYMLTCTACPVDSFTLETNEAP